MLFVTGFFFIFIVGGLTAVVALLGVWAGWESVSGAEPVANGAQAVLPPPTTWLVPLSQPP